MNKKVSATLSVAALYNLLNKKVEVTFKDDSRTSGELTDIGSFELEVNDGTSKHCDFPSWIELDGESTYRWRIENVQSIKPYAPRK